jgi:L-ascorbate metabolism protein UlaG (beta-lactamase superfamily)
MKITYYGHACFGVQTANTHLLFDPFITPNELAKHIKIESVPANYIFVSHGHADHIIDAAQIAKRTGATVVSNFEITTWLGKQGVEKTHPLNLGGGYRFRFGRAQLVTALHSSSLPDGSYGGNPGGFVIETGEGNFYYSGDTALTLDMKLIGEATKLKFAALPIGDNFTMGVTDAVRAAGYVGCDQVVGLHFDTFPPIKIDREAAVREFKAAGKTLHLLNPGQSVEL